MVKAKHVDMLNVIQNSGLRWLWLSVLAIALDQATKLWILAEFELYESVNILPHFNLTYVRNYGAAFSFLSDAGGWQRWFFTAIAIGVSIMLVWWLRKEPKEKVILPVALSLILGGAIGNLYDRLAYGYVVDFLDVYYDAALRWPAFNIADSAIFLGAAFLIWDAFKNNDSEEDASSAKK